ncbi:MAG: nucleoside monophosphate kinase [Candidatus Saccharimonadales bacterium]
MTHDTLLSDDQLATIKAWLGSGSINIFGLPFAGKDTHGHKLADLLDASLLSSGDVFRATTLDPDAQRALDNGELPSSDVFMQVFTPYLSKPAYANHPLILSSVGRWIGEEQGILQATHDSGHPIKAVVYLHLSEAMVHTRYHKSQELGDRGDRADDEAHKLETRIAEFNNKTLPVIEEYRKLGLLIEVNSDAEKHEVLETILARLYMTASAR